MTSLQKLSITKLRNISASELQLSPRINLFYGLNGSGKTSLLEAIHLLGLAKSFRSSPAAPLIQNGETECAVFARLTDGGSLGFSRNKSGEQRIKLNGKKAQNSAELASILPLQLINADAFRILEGSPRERRQFLDWGVFHVEHGFLEHWRQSQKALQNRNSLLKAKTTSPDLIEPWTHELCRHAEQLDRSRDAYLKSFRPVFFEILGALLEAGEVSLVYERGWDKDRSLREVLDTGLVRDMKYGHTLPGPQRADLRFRIDGENAVDCLSRGQQKLFVIALKLAQGFLLKRLNGRPCLYLIDDLPAELDAGNREKVCSLLTRLEAQACITGIEKEALEAAVAGAQGSLFHVKHGKIEAL